MTAAKKQIDGFQLANRCITSVYLCMGVLGVLKSRCYRTLYEKLTDGYGQGQDGLVGDLVDIAIAHDDWLEEQDVDIEDMTDGVYLYEVVEDILAKKVAAYASDHGHLPTREALTPILESIRNDFQNKQYRSL